MLLTAVGHGREPMTYLTDQFWYHQNQSAMTNVTTVTELPGIDNLPGELWKPVSGYDGKYHISDKGRVASQKTTSLKKNYITMKGGISSHGYRVVGLSKYGSRKVVNGKVRHPAKTKYIHRLLAEHWLPNPNPSVTNIIDHIDGNKLNNSLLNLEWVTGEENVRRAFNEQGLIKQKGELHRYSKLTQEDVIKARTLTAKGMKHKDVSAIIGKVSRRTLSESINGDTWEWLTPTVDDLIEKYSDINTRLRLGERAAMVSDGVYVTDSGRAFLTISRGILREYMGASKTSKVSIPHEVCKAFNTSNLVHGQRVLHFVDGNKYNWHHTNLVWKRKPTRKGYAYDPLEVARNKKIRRQRECAKRKASRVAHRAAKIAHGENPNGNSKLNAEDVLLARYCVANGDTVKLACERVGKCSYGVMKHAVRGSAYEWVIPSLADMKAGNITKELAEALAKRRGQPINSYN